MTPRGFDPTFSAALRDELEHRAEAPARADRAEHLAVAVRPRRQAVIAVVVAVVLAVLTVGVLQAAARPVRSAPAGRVTSSTPSADAVVDPLSVISDPSSGGDYLTPGSYRVLLHRTGTGPLTSAVTVPAGIGSVRTYLACRSGDYRVTVGKSTWASCAHSFAAYADIPVSPGRHEVGVAVADGVPWSLLVITTPSAAPTSSPSSTPTPTPSPTETATAPPTAAPVPTPTLTPTTSAPSPTTASASAPTPSTALLTPTGWHVITRDELHAYVEQRGFDAIWEEQAWLDVRCMAKQGFVYDPVDGGVGAVRPSGLTPAQQDAYKTAMYGPDTDQPYDWRTAGCHGASVHETGMDDAN